MTCDMVEVECPFTGPANYHSLTHSLLQLKVAVTSSIFPESSSDIHHECSSTGKDKLIFTTRSLTAKL